MNIPVKMKAMVLTNPGKWEITEVDVLTPGPEEVLCKIDAVAICGNGPEIIHGGLAGIWPLSYPFIASHRWAGTVVASGNKSRDFKIEDRVAGGAHKGCGYYSNCLGGSYNLCLSYGRNNTGHRHYGFTSQSAYAQYNVYHIKSPSKLPNSVSFEEAAMCDTAGVVLHGLELTRADPGSIIAITGPGPIGIMAMELSRTMGVSRIPVVGRMLRLEAAGNLDADELMDFPKCNPVDEIRRLTGGLGANLVLECSGASGTITQSLGMCCKGGRVVMLGVAKDGVTEPIPSKYMTHNELTLYGPGANPNTGRKIVEMTARGQLKVKDMVTHIFTLNEINLAFETLEKHIGGAMKVIIYPNK